MAGIRLAGWAATRMLGQKAAVDRLGIAVQAPKRAEALSGGQQQRVAIARALRQNPKVILADQPIASLGPMNTKIVMDTLRRISTEDGRMVIANLHRLDTARRYCDRVIGILGGENAQDRLTSNECFRAAMETALGVPVRIFTPADCDGVIQGLLGGTLDYAWLGASAQAKIYLTDPHAVEVKPTRLNPNDSTGCCSIGFARNERNAPATSPPVTRRISCPSNTRPATASLPPASCRKACDTNGSLT